MIAFAEFLSSSFTAASRCRADPRATLTSPAAGSTLTGSSATFTWTTGTGADGYWLDVGASVGQGNLSSGFQTTVSRTITNLPGTGRAPCTSGSGRESAESTRRRSTTRLTKVSETNPNRRLGGSPWYERQFMLLALSLLTAFRVSFRTRGDTPLT